MKFSLVKVGIFLLATICLLATVILLLPYPKHFGYHLVKGVDFKKVAWVYQRIFSSQESVDIAIIGTSQSYYGLQDTLIEKLLSDQGINKNVVNLAFPGLGRNQHYVVVDDLLSRKKPQSIIIEVMECEHRGSHKAAIYMASNKQAARFLTAVNFNLFRDLDGFYTSRKRCFRDMLMGKNANSGDMPIATEDISFKTVDLVITKQEMELKRVQLEKIMNPAILPESYWNIEYGFPISMIEDICLVAQTKGVQCYFLYVARYGAPALPNPYFMELYSRYGEVLIPPSTIWNNPSFYCDDHHLNSQGADTLSRWVAGELSDRLR